jgi:hypothetical protein
MRDKIQFEEDGRNFNGCKNIIRSAFRFAIQEGACFSELHDKILCDLQAVAFALFDQVWPRGVSGEPLKKRGRNFSMSGPEFEMSGVPSREASTPDKANRLPKLTQFVVIRFLVLFRSTVRSIRSAVLTTAISKPPELMPA